MAKKPANSGKSWSSKQDSQLRSLAKQNTPTRVVGLKMGRTPGSIQSRASDLKISLKPTNQSPYGTKKKQQRQAYPAGRVTTAYKQKKGHDGPSFAFVHIEYFKYNIY